MFKKFVFAVAFLIIWISVIALLVYAGGDFRIKVGAETAQEET